MDGSAPQSVHNPCPCHDGMMQSIESGLVDIGSNM